MSDQLSLLDCISRAKARRAKVTAAATNGTLTAEERHRQFDSLIHDLNDFCIVADHLALEQELGFKRAWALKDNKPKVARIFSDASGIESRIRYWISKEWYDAKPIFPVHRHEDKPALTATLVNRMADGQLDSSTFGELEIMPHHPAIQKQGEWWTMDESNPLFDHRLPRVIFVVNIYPITISKQSFALKMLKVPAVYRGNFRPLTTISEALWFGSLFAAHLGLTVGLSPLNDVW